MGKTLIIAEPASAHDGDLSKALRLINEAVRAGADIVKFEFWSDPDLLADRRRVPPVYREHYRRSRVPLDWLPTLKARCEHHHVEFMATTYLPQDIAVIDPFVQRFKIAGFEVQDTAFLEAHRIYGKPVIASVPLSVEKPARDDRTFAWLHTVQAYPTAPQDLHLRRIRDQGFDGFSDHSGQIDTGFAAVMAGATIVEAHLKLKDTDPKNLDAGPHAHTPASFLAYVAGIRHAERMLGDGVPAPTIEQAMARFRV